LNGPESSIQACHPLNKFCSLEQVRMVVFVQDLALPGVLLRVSDDGAEGIPKSDYSEKEAA